MPEQAITETTDTQLGLPLSREEHLQLVRAFRMTKLALVSRVMVGNLATMLEVIEMNSGSDGCRMSRELFCAKLNIDLRTLKRWQKMLLELRVVKMVQRWLNGGKGRQAENLIRIDWYCVRRLINESAAPIGETLFAHDWTDDGETLFVHVDAGETQHVHSAGNDQNIPPRVDMDVDARQVFAPPGGAIAPPGGALLPERGGALSISAPPMVNGTKDPQEKRTLEPFHPIQTKSLKPIAYHSSPLPLGGQFSQSAGAAPDPFPLDRCPLSPDLLRSPRDIERWFQFALDRRWVRECDRLRVFRAAHSVMRRAASLNSVEGAFVQTVKRKLWHQWCQADEEWARKAIHWIDNQQLTAGH